MEKSAEHIAILGKNDDTALVEILKALRELKADNLKVQQRLAKIETTIDRVAQDRSAVPPQSGGNNYDAIDKYITEQIQSGLEHESREDGEADDESDPNWNYFIAQKGGFDEILYMTVQDFLNLDRKKDTAQLLKFLLQKRNDEVKESFEHLRTEYDNLEGHQLQKHFTELWELHHNLLKKKIIRTWKEEIFLEAFDEFLTYLQQ